MAAIYVFCYFGGGVASLFVLNSNGCIDYSVITICWSSEFYLSFKKHSSPFIAEIRRTYINSAWDREWMLEIQRNKHYNTIAVCQLLFWGGGYKSPPKCSEIGVYGTKKCTKTGICKNVTFHPYGMKTCFWQWSFKGGGKKPVWQSSQLFGRKDEKLGSGWLWGKFMLQNIKKPSCLYAKLEQSSVCRQS